MAVVERFCFYFSVRLGSIIIGVLNLIQIVIWLGLIFYNMDHTDVLIQRIDDLLNDDEYDLLYATDFLKNLRNDPNRYFSYGIAFFAIFAFSCGAMIFGVYKLKSRIVYPFVVITFIYITSLLTLHILFMLIVKKNDHGLGPLILYSVIGEFVFLYLYYTWFCVVGYCQIIHDLKKRVNKVKTFDNQKLFDYPVKATGLHPGKSTGLYPGKPVGMYPKLYY